MIIQQKNKLTMRKLINKIFNKKQPEIKKPNPYGSYFLQFYIPAGNGRNHYLMASEKRKNNKHLEKLRKRVNEILKDEYFESIYKYSEKVKEILDDESRNIFNKRDY